LYSIPVTITLLKMESNTSESTKKVTNTVTPLHVMALLQCNSLQNNYDGTQGPSQNHWPCTFKWAALLPLGIWTDETNSFSCQEGKGELLLMSLSLFNKPLFQRNFHFSVFRHLGSQVRPSSRNAYNRTGKMCKTNHRK